MKKIQGPLLAEMHTFSMIFEKNTEKGSIEKTNSTPQLDIKF